MFLFSEELKLSCYRKWQVNCVYHDSWGSLVHLLAAQFIAFNHFENKVFKNILMLQILQRYQCAQCFYGFFKKFLADTHVLFWGPLVPLFWISGDISSGFHSQNGFCLICIVEANVMYIPQDPPLMLNLLTSWQPARSRSCPHILLQRWGCRDSNSCSQNICELGALPTELNRDRPVRSVFVNMCKYYYPCCWYTRNVQISTHKDI